MTPANGRNESKVGAAGACQASWDEIIDGALRHYEDISRQACHWSNTIPKALEFYRRSPAAEKLAARLRDMIYRDIGPQDMADIIEDALATYDLAGRKKETL